MSRTFFIFYTFCVSHCFPHVLCDKISLTLQGGVLMNLGETIRSLRNTNDMTQKELADKLSISPSTIGMYEQNRREPDLDMLSKIANIFNVTIDYFVETEKSNKADLSNIKYLRIAEERKKLGLSQEELAKKLKVSQKSISKYECGDRRPSYETLALMSSTFGVSIDYLLGNDIPNKPNSKSDSIQNNYSFYFFDDVLKNIFTSRLKKLLTEKNLSLNKFSEIASLNIEKCNSYINGEYAPSLEDLTKISHALNVSIDYLLGETQQITDTEKKLLNTFIKLNEDNQDIIIGEAKKLLKEQHYEESVAAEESLKRTGTDDLGK